MASREQDVFHRALEIPAGQRAQFLAETCGPDEPLRRRIESLLSAAESAGGFLGGHAEETGEEPGSRLGAYRLAERLGEGGFGVVYRAEQEHPVRRMVALKIIKLGMDTRAVVARFEAERQALALMEHPHIARVFDAGATASGRPYFVMELVSGQPITTFCREWCLPVRARLELFLQVCRAVHHAHQKGVIHRDLKPTNVLVSVAEQRPVAKVIDFGIAKATATPLTGATLLSRLQLFVGTPAYMSPEQFGLGSDDIDTRSDIYSLGTMLHELLVGGTPVDIAVLSQGGYAALERAIRDQDYPLPSQRLRSGPPETLARVAAERLTTPARLVAQLQGDLDQIVRKCLEKNRDHRYGTAEDLARDLERHLRDEPVQARAATWTYRAGKFVRRYRRPVAGAALALLLLAALSVYYTRQLAAERDRAQLAAKRAEGVSALLTLQLGASDPYRTPVADEQADILARVRRDFADEPDVRLDILSTVGRVLLRRGQQAQAEAVLLEALAAGHEVGRPLPYFGQTLNDLGVLHRERADFAAAQRFLERAVQVRRQIIAEVGPNDVAVSLVELGRNHLALEQLDRAETLFREALELRRQAYGAEHREIATSLGDLAELEWLWGHLRNAEMLWQESLAMHRRTVGPEHPNVASVLVSLALLRADQGKTADAESMMREGLAMFTRILGPKHWRTARALGLMGSIERRQGRLGEAERLLRTASAILSENPGRNPALVARLETELARVLLQRGEGGAAEPPLRAALETQMRLYPRGGWHVAIAQSLLGGALLQQGRLAEAGPRLLEAHAVLCDVPGPQGVETKATRERLVALYTALGQPEQAARYRQAGAP